ncbi:MAG: hypothetical protein JOS17DRAFT_770588 [Linnemannia elongata]|nr:MAG: hypothetical protein JOS17DRAFT_770588 [Linnemannia elongata]
MPRAILVLRIWLAFVCFFNLAIVSTYYGLIGGLNGLDYGILIPSILLFLSYLYSIWGEPLASSKYIRAFLMLIPALVLIGCSSYLIHLQIIGAEFYNEYMGESQGSTYNPFTCDYFGGGSGIGYCFLAQSYNFAPIITDVFVIIEVLVTLLRGPLHPFKAEH